VPTSPGCVVRFVCVSDRQIGGQLKTQAIQNMVQKQRNYSVFDLNLKLDSSLFQDCCLRERVDPPPGRALAMLLALGAYLNRSD
jgi:hypothetical protein